MPAPDQIQSPDRIGGGTPFHLRWSAGGGVREGGEWCVILEEMKVNLLGIRLKMSWDKEVICKK